MYLAKLQTIGDVRGCKITIQEVFSGEHEEDVDNNGFLGYLVKVGDSRNWFFIPGITCPKTIPKGLVGMMQERIILSCLSVGELFTLTDALRIHLMD